MLKCTLNREEAPWISVMLARRQWSNWNGPPIAMADILGDILGAGAGFQVILLFTIFPFDRWHFITVANKADSQVTKKLKKEQPNLPFFS